MKTRKETYDKEVSMSIWFALLKAEFIVSDDYDQELQARLISRQKRVLNLVSNSGVSLIEVLPNFGFVAQKELRDGNTWIRYVHPKAEFEIIHLDLLEYPNILNGTLVFL